LIKLLHGPDFPTGGIVANKNDLPEIYRTGKGRIKVRGKIEFEPATRRGEHDRLVVTEIPYTMIGLGIEKFLSDVADLAKSKTLPEVTDILNQTNSQGVRLVIELKNGSDIERIKNILYKKTKLEDTLPVNMLYVVDGRPITLNLKQIFEEFGKFNYETKRRKYTALLQKNKEIVEIRDGLITAIDAIDAIIEVLRGSKNITDAKNCLMGISSTNVTFKTKAAQKVASKFAFTELQAQAILDMKLSRLINLELDILVKEKKEAEKQIALCEKLLASKKEMTKVIVSELEEIKKKYGKARKTEITNAESIDVDLNVVTEMEMYMAYDKYGYIRLFDLPTYTRNKDAIEESATVIKTKNTGTIFVFTDTGNLHQMKVKDIPTCKAKDRGTPCDNLCNYDSTKENIILITSIEDMTKAKYALATSNNLIKTFNGDELVTVRKTIAYTKLDDGAKVIMLSAIEDNGQIIAHSAGNYFLNIELASIPNQKRGAAGARCMALKDGDTLKNVFYIKKGQKEFVIPELSKTVKVDRPIKGKRGTAGKVLRI
jgi:DNA gyrase subunit A